MAEASDKIVQAVFRLYLTIFYVYSNSYDFHLNHPLEFELSDLHTMAGSSANVDLYLKNTWDLQRIDPDDVSIQNGVVLNAIMECGGKKFIGPARKTIESRLGRLIDDSLFYSHAKKLLKLHSLTTKSIRDVKKWDEYQAYCNLLWAIPDQRPPKQPDSVPSNSNPSNSDPPFSQPTPSKRLRSDCENCLHHIQKIKELKLEHAEEIQRLLTEKNTLLKDLDLKTKERKNFRQNYLNQKTRADKKNKELIAARARVNRTENVDVLDVQRQLKNVRISNTFKDKKIAEMEEIFTEVSRENRALKKDVKELDRAVENLEVQVNEKGDAPDEEETPAWV